MVDFTNLDEEKLEELRKALAKTASTTTTRQPWQEHFGRETSTTAAKSLLAADIIRGFSGSWAASYNYGYGAGITPNTVNENRADTSEVPIPIRAKTTKLGRRGVPDIDFVPYNWRTNRFGFKGPSLVGHPISYEVVGPTLKSPFCDWTWQVNLGTGPNGGDELTMFTRPDGNPAVASTLADGYGAGIPVFTIGDANEPNGGLYVIITDDGANAGSIPAGETPMGARSEFIDTARYEIFRVASATADTLELHPNKSLATYFDLTGPLPRTIRAITVIKPYVTRLAAVPDSGPGPGQERVFVVVSPEISASSDLYPPYDGGTGAWRQGGFDANPGETPSGILGSADRYLGRMPLPIPIPLRKGLAQVDTTAAAAPTNEIGLTFISDHPSTPITSSGADIGRILRVYDIQSEDDTDLTFGTPPATLGWFPCYDVEVGPPSGFVLGRTAEVAPETGHLYFGPGPFLQDAVGPKHDLVYTVHDPVSDLWQGPFNIDKVQACRLQNLIDPHEVSRFEKQTSQGVSGTSQPGGSSFSGPDKAIWDTSKLVVPAALDQAPNPGSLLDLGFRMVLFPAKNDGSDNPIPDFDKPIETRGGLVINPGIAEDQYLEVDYSAGLVRLSHEPPQVSNGGQGDIIPNGLIGGVGTTNPRFEVVLFAACVPFSMEESQLGTGARIVSRPETDDIDLYSGRVRAEIDLNNTNPAGVPPYVGASAVAPNPVEIVLDQIWTGPSTGVFEILDDTNTGASFGLWGYSETRDVTVLGRQVTALGGITSLPTTISDPGLGGSTPRVVVLRREVFFAEKSAEKDFGVDNATNDTTYGSAARAKTVRFDNATLLPELDGSVTIRQNQAPRFADWIGLLTASTIPDPVPPGIRLSQNGVFEDTIYEDTGNPTGGPSQGFVTFAAAGHPEGPVLIFPSSGLGTFSGFLTKASRIRLDHIARLVYKFGFISELNSPPQPEMTAFIGLGSPEWNGSIGIVGALGNVVAPYPPAAPGNYVGIRVEGNVGPPGPAAQFDWMIGNLGGATFAKVNTGIVPEDHGNVFYLVIETSRTDPVIKMALFDSELTRLSAITFATAIAAVPNLTSPMEVMGGVLDSAAATISTHGLAIWWISYLNRIDLPYPVF